MAATLIRWLLLVGGLLVSLPSFAEEVWVYTMGPGDDLFSRFGHAAICVEQRCYNYGTADFATPLPLTWDFVRGRARFWVSVMDHDRMVDAYIRMDRTLYRQRLPLPAAQTLQIAQALEASTDEKVRYYQYHHFHDNCTTRIRDLLDQQMRGALRQGEVHNGPTFRDYAKQGFAGNVPLLLVVDLLLGRPADQPTSLYQGMFLPDVLRNALAERLHAQPELVYTRRAPLPAAGSIHPGQVGLAASGIVLGLLILLWARRKPGNLRYWRGLVGVLLGVPACILWALAVLSAFPELRWNENLLCFWPSDLLLPWFPSGGRSYLKVRLGVLGVCVLFSLLGVFVQPLFPVLIFCGTPLAVLLFASEKV